MLERAELAARSRSDSLLVIRNGALVLERYWNDKTQNDFQQCPTAEAFGPALSLARGTPSRSPAEEDSFLMFGAGGRIGIPSLRLVIVRSGGGSGSIYDADYYGAALVRLICAAVNQVE